MEQQEVALLRKLESILGSDGRPKGGKEAFEMNLRWSGRDLSTDRIYQIKNFEIQSFVQTGKSSVSYKAKHDIGTIELKCLTSSKPESIKNSYKELELLRRLRHPQVQPIYGAFHEDYSYLVLELCYGTFIIK